LIEAMRVDLLPLSPRSVFALSALFGLLLGHVLISAVSAAAHRNAVIDAATLSPARSKTALLHPSPSPPLDLAEMNLRATIASEVIVNSPAANVP